MRDGRDLSKSWSWSTLSTGDNRQLFVWSMVCDFCDAFKAIMPEEFEADREIKIQVDRFTHSGEFLRFKGTSIRAAYLPESLSQQNALERFVAEVLWNIDDPIVNVYPGDWVSVLGT